MSDGTMSSMPGSTTAEGDDNRATAERYLSALSGQDFDAIREIFADDVQVQWPQSGEHFKGKETCLRVFSAYPGGSPKLLGITRVSASGDLVVGEAELEYPDGKRYLSVAILQFRDGKIVHEVDYFTERFPAPEWRIQYGVEHDPS
jgi:ketosteroid isomerase-like protein